MNIDRLIKRSIKHLEKGNRLLNQARDLQRQTTSLLNKQQKEGK